MGVFIMFARESPDLFGEISLLLTSLDLSSLMGCNARGEGKRMTGRWQNELKWSF